MIKNVALYPHFDASGELTLKVKVWTHKGFFTASVPTGTSKGSNEAKNVPVGKATKVFPHLRKNLIGLDENDWTTADEIIKQSDSEEKFGTLGSSMALGCSIAIARAATEGELWRLEGPKKRMEFPFPISNVIGGGLHGGNTSWQEFLIIPHRAKNPLEASRTNYEVWKYIGGELERRKLVSGRNLENAWMSKMDEYQTLDFLSEIAEQWDLRLGLDVAASSFWNGKEYVYRNCGKRMSPEQHLDFLVDAVKKYGIYYVEDPFHEEDFWMSMELMKALPSSLIVGDDLFCTNLERLKKCRKLGCANGIILKPNQIGTLYDAFRTADYALKNGIHSIASHRSRETFDDWISDLSLLWKSPLIKIGCRGFDTAKHNRLIELWNDVPDCQMAVLPLQSSK